MATGPGTHDAQLARHRVRDQIQRAILIGDYPAGTRLTQIQLAKRFGVAQSVVRESLLELQFCGLVKSVDKLGVFVRELGARQLSEAFEIREMLEGLAARLCCERLSPAHLREMEAKAAEIHALGTAERWGEMGAADRAFHDQLVRLSQNDLLDRLTDSYRILGMAVQANRDIDEVRVDHMAIVRAIERQEPDGAERLARHHVRAARESVERQIEAGGFDPQWVVGEPPDPNTVEGDSAARKEPRRGA